MNKLYNLARMLPQTFALGISVFMMPAQVQAQCVAPSVGCAGNDRSNAFISSTTPATIEYDNIVSVFHSTMARQADGRVLVWGERMASSGAANILSPQELNATNYPGLSGEILKFTSGSQTSTNSHNFILTTNGLYFWGNDLWGVGNATTAFQKLTIGGQTNGLPAGVLPADIKMMFGSSRVLAIVTCSGAVYTLVAATNAATASAYGDNAAFSTANNIIWHRVRISAAATLDNVIAVRGNGRQSLMAFTSTGQIYTWGQSTYLGDNNTFATRNYATLMTAPAAGITPKMIGMTAGAADNTSTYYYLATNGNLYSLGFNGQRQLGDFTTTTRNQWGRVQRTATATDFLTNVVWISPNEHDLGFTNAAAINVITSDTLLYAWGGNNRTMIGGPAASTSIDPATNLGGLTAADKIIAVETGGHTTMAIRKCSSNFGYVGHKSGGSMGDNTSTDVDIPNYTFSTSQMNVCGASTSAATLFPVANATVGNTYNMIASPAGGTFTVLSGPAIINSSTGAITITGAGTIQVRYQITTGICPSATQVSFTSSLPVPITLEAFNVSKKKDAVLLEWIINKEVNNRGFEIQKSPDATSWNTIGFVASQAANGNSTERSVYSYTDNSPSAGRNYYRLKQIDHDGAFDYSLVRQITFGANDQVHIYPNPAKEKIYVEGLNENNTVRLFDPSGRLVLEHKVKRYTAEISIAELSNGIYYLEVSSENGTQVREKIVKE